MVTRFQIKGTIYRAEDLNSIKLIDMFAFDEQVFAFRLTEEGKDFPDLQWVDVEAAMEEINKLTPAAAMRHRRAKLVTAATIWLTLRSAGTPMPFGELLEVDLSKDFQELPDPADKAPKANPTKGTAKKSPSRKPSAAAAKQPKPDAN